MALCNLPAVIALSVALLASDCTALRMPNVMHTNFHSAVQRADASVPRQLPSPTAAGYLPLESNATLYFAYYESQAPPTHETPIILWLQGGPGCASLFGNFFELGPQVLNNEGVLTDNAFAWNRRYGLLFIDQPVGSGFSRPGANGIPTEEMAVAADVYQGLQRFYTQQPHFRHRPLFITGESYAGKYVPSIGHFILQMEQRAGEQLQSGPPLQFSRLIPDTSLQPPVFRLAGLAIGDGLTDPLTQVRTHADTAYWMGAIDEQQRRIAQQQERAVARLIRQRRWREAHAEREALLQYIQASSGVATLYDLRRRREYDSRDNVGKFVNRPDVKVALHAQPDATFVACSDNVADALGPDVMKSVKHLIPDILVHIPVLLYQGQFDLQDGVATSQAWISTLRWPGQRAFKHAKRHIWRLPIRTHDGGVEQGAKCVAGYVKSAGPLTQVVITNAGHMLPHDQGEAAVTMLENWVDKVLGSSSK